MNKPLIIGCDKDGVINNFTYEFLCRYNDLLKESDSKYKPVDPTWEPPIYWMQDNPEVDSEIIKQVSENLELIMDKSPLYPGAMDFLDKLLQISEYTFIVTHQYTDAAKLASYEWLVKNKISLSCIFEHGLTKHLHCDILIDDKIENLYAHVEAGKDAICVARAWNSEYKGRRFKTYNEIVKYISEKYDKR